MRLYFTELLRLIHKWLDIAARLLGGAAAVAKAIAYAIEPEEEDDEEEE